MTLKVDNIAKADGSKSLDTDTLIEGSAKSWVSFQMDGTPQIRDSFNTSSFTDVQTGYVKFNFTNSFVDEWYACTFGQQASAFYGRDSAIASPTEYQINSFNYNGDAQDLSFGAVHILGDLA